MSCSRREFLKQTMAGAVTAAIPACSVIFLAPGEAQNVTVAINPQTAPSPEEEQERKKKGAGFWNNPVTATLVVIGSATLLGYLIKSGTDDESNASPSSM